MSDLRVLLTLAEVEHQLAVVTASGGTVPCRDHADYWCDGCLVLAACSARDTATDSGGVRCRG